MANLPISALDVQTTLLDTDLLVVVDTTDHSMGITGTDKQITAANVIAGVKTALVTVPNTLVPFGDISSDLTTDANFNYSTSTLTAPTIKGSTALQVKESGGTDTISIVAPASIPSSYTLTLPDQVGTSGQVLSTTGAGVLTFTTNAGGDVFGPVSSTDNALVRFDGITGKLIQNSVGILDDAGALSALTQLDVDNLELNGNTISSTNTNGNIILTPDGTGITTTSKAIQSDVGFVAKQTTAGSNAITIQSPSTIASSYSLTLPAAPGTVGQFVTTTDNSGTLTFSTLTPGDVFGPGSSTNGDVVLFNGTTGKLIKDSNIQLSSGASGAIALGNSSSATASNAIALGNSVTNSTANSIFTITSLTSTTGNPLVYNASGQLGPSITPTFSSITNGGTITVPSGSDTLVARNTADILTNKTLTSTTNTVRATQLGTTGADVNVASATAPSTGQVLTATSGSTATWQTPASGGVTSVNTLTGALTMSQIVARNDSGSAGGTTSIQIGSSSSAGDTNTIAIGTSATTGSGGGSVEAIAIGKGASAQATKDIAIGNSTAATGSSVAIGDSCATSLGGYVAIGVLSTATGNACVAIGNATARGTRGIAIGGSSTGSSSNDCIAIGSAATSTTGTYNISMGYLTGSSTFGNANICIGANAMSAISAAVSNCVFIGNSSATGIMSTTAPNGTVGVGDKQLNALTTGAHNTAIGYNGGSTIATTTGSNNTFVGYGITSAATTSDNTIVGNSATAGTVGGVCILGSSATASATDSIAIGRSASATTGTANIAIGQAASSTGATSGAIAIGLSSRAAGTDAIAIGRLAMNASGGADNNIAIGVNALNACNSSGTRNVCIGFNSGQKIAQGINNTALGYNTLSNSNVNTQACVAIGQGVMTGALTTAANGAVGIGSNALGANTSGAHNTHVGYNGSNTVATTTGSDNTFLGYGITSAATVSNNTIIGSTATAATFSGCSILGMGATATANNQLVLRVGNSATTELVSTLAVATNVTAAIGTNTYLPVTINGVAYKIALFT